MVWLAKKTSREHGGKISDSLGSLLLMLALLWTLSPAVLLAQDEGEGEEKAAEEGTYRQSPEELATRW